MFLMLLSVTCIVFALSQRQGVNDASTGMVSSYSWVIMVIHYLQHYAGLLPDLQVQRYQQH
jgi:DNA polymerase sigma